MCPNLYWVVYTYFLTWYSQQPSKIGIPMEGEVTEA